MTYLIVVTLSGIILFSSVTNEIFSYKKLQTVNKIVKERVHSIEAFLYEISSVVKNKNLSLQIIHLSKCHIEEAIKNSTRFYFESNRFYRELPPRLKHKLVANVLLYEIEKFKYFFKDFQGRNKAPDTFIVEVLTHLDS